VDLSLENIELVAGSGHLLARLLSSACCPSLQKLQLWNLRLPRLNKLLIEASALLELSISNGPIAGPETLLAFGFSIWRTTPISGRLEYLPLSWRSSPSCVINLTISKFLEHPESEFSRALRCTAIEVISTKPAGALAARRELARLGAEGLLELVRDDGGDDR
jgi:hypothetical protein